MARRKIGQITIKRIGDKFAICISGNPQELLETAKLAEKAIAKLRDKHGRRNYEYKNKRKCNGRK